MQRRNFFAAIAAMAVGVVFKPVLRRKKTFTLSPYARMVTFKPGTTLKATGIVHVPQWRRLKKEMS